MQNTSSFRLFASVLAALLAAGCTTRQVSAKYLVPAREVADVRSVDVLVVEAKVSLAGNQVAKGDSARVAALARQMLSSELYRRGFYRVEDDVWGSPGGAAGLAHAVVLGGSRHGYGTLVTEESPAKARLVLDIQLSYDVQKTTQKQTFELTTTPYVVHRPTAASESAGLSQVPFSTPDMQNITTRKVESSWAAWEASAKGKLRVSLEPKGAEEPVYTRDFSLSCPSAAGVGASPLVRVAAAALSPAVNEIVADISPSTNSRWLVLSKGGNDRAKTLIAAGAYPDAIELIEALPKESVTLGDLENLGVAYELVGDYSSASGAYERALAMDPENEALRMKMNDLAKAAKAKKTFRESGAKANSDTSFKAR